MPICCALGGDARRGRVRGPGPSPRLGGPGRLPASPVRPPRGRGRFSGDLPGAWRGRPPRSGAREPSSAGSAGWHTAPPWPPGAEHGKPQTRRFSLRSKRGRTKTRRGATCGPCSTRRWIGCRRNIGCRSFFATSRAHQRRSGPRAGLPGWNDPVAPEPRPRQTARAANPARFGSGRGTVHRRIGYCFDSGGSSRPRRDNGRWRRWCSRRARQRPVPHRPRPQHWQKAY